MIVHPDGRLEGTPEEIWHYIQRKQAHGTNLKPSQPMPDWTGPWWGIFPPDTIHPRTLGGGTADYVGPQMWINS